MPEKRTYADRAEYIKRAVTKRRKKLKTMLVEYKGGQCAICGYNRSPDVLEFHHIDESKKEFGLSIRGLTRSWERMRVEADKCILLCANCHREVHAGVVQLPQVSGDEK